MLMQYLQITLPRVYKIERVRNFINIFSSPEMIRVHGTNANDMQVKIIYWLNFIDDIFRI